MTKTGVSRLLLGVGAVLLALVVPAQPVLAGERSDAGPAAADGGKGDWVATFRVAGVETFRMRLTDADDIATAQQLLKGGRPLVPSGQVVYGYADVNTGWSWHIDPKSVAFSVAAIEVCDGLPSHVENHQITSPYYCPWSALIQTLEPAPFPYDPRR